MVSALRTTNMTHNRRPAPAKSRQQGFALLETLIAIVILMIGLLAVLATFSMALGNTNTGQLDSIGRQKGTQALESIFTAPQTNQIRFANIHNIAPGTGMFTPGVSPMTEPRLGQLDGPG